MKKLFTALFSICIFLSATYTLAQTGNFSTINLTATTGNALSSTGSGNRPISLTNDDITGVNAVKLNDTGLAEGLVFGTAVDISVARAEDDGFAAFIFRTNAANPYIFNSSSSANIMIDATGSGGFFSSKLGFGSSRSMGYEISYFTSPTPQTGHLNLYNTSTNKGLHIGSEHVWTDGNIGIGTLTPTTALEVGKGNSIVTINTALSGQDRFAGIDWKHGTNIPYRMFYSSFPSPERSGYLHLQSQPSRFGIHFNANDIWFSTDDKIGSTTELQENHKFIFDGQVAIGTVKFPVDENGVRFNLSVDGKALFEQCWVANSTDWPDYVFHKNYKLQSLEEVDEYVKNNSHLPGVPSAEELSKTGINVGNMEATLLKKIEELTLYLIETNNELKQINQKIQQLEQENASLRSKSPTKK